MIVSHKIQFKDLKSEQIEHFKQASGVARFTYNWALSRYKEQLEIYKKSNLKEDKPNILNLKKEFNSIRKEQFPWTYSVSKCVSARSFTNLQKAFSNFFNKNTKSKFPKFKSKNNSNNSFYIDNYLFKVDNKTVKLPIIGLVKLTESLKFVGKIMSGTISESGGKWFISVAVDILENPSQFIKKNSNINLVNELKIQNFKENKSESVGIDLGIKTVVVTSDGEEIQSPKPLKKHLKKLKRLQRRHSKKVGGIKYVNKERVVEKNSQNKEKSRVKLARLHYKISSIRKDWLHKVSKYLCESYSSGVIALEDLQVSGMVRNHKLARAIIDVGFGMFRSFIEYKSVRFKNELRVIDKWYPSSKLCSECGTKNPDLKLSDRVYQCINPNCNLNLNPIDRDYNASVNIRDCGFDNYKVITYSILWILTNQKYL